MESSGHGKSRNTKRVYTHRANTPFNFQSWADTSPPEHAFDFIKTVPVVRIHKEKKYTLSPTAQSSFDAQEAYFKQLNSKDMIQDYSVQFEIGGFREFTLMHNDELGYKPWYLDRCTYTLLCFIGFSWVQRIAFMRNSKEVQINISKHIYA